MEFAGPSIIIYHLTYVSTFVWHKMQQPPVLSTLHNHKIYSGPSLAGKLYNLTARSVTAHLCLMVSSYVSVFISITPIISSSIHPNFHLLLLHRVLSRVTSR